MSLEIEYRDASYRPGAYGSGRKVRRVEAIFGAIHAHGANRAEAKAALLEEIKAQCEHCFTRRYFPAGGGVMLALSYCRGWQVEYVYPDGRIGGSTSFGADSEYEAIEYARRTAEQRAEVAA